MNTMNRIELELQAYPWVLTTLQVVALVLLVWLVATFYKINLCVQLGLQACR